MGIFNILYDSFVEIAYGKDAINKNIGTKPKEAVEHIFYQSLIKFASGMQNINDERLFNACMAAFTVRTPWLESATREVIRVLANYVNSLDDRRPTAILLISVQEKKKRLSPDLMIVETLERERLLMNRLLKTQAERDEARGQAETWEARCNDMSIDSSTLTGNAAADRAREAAQNLLGAPVDGNSGVPDAAHPDVPPAAPVPDGDAVLLTGQDTRTRRAVATVDGISKLAGCTRGPVLVTGTGADDGVYVIRRGKWVREG